MDVGGAWLDSLINSVTLDAGQSAQDGALGIRATCETGVVSGSFYGPAVPINRRGGNAVLLPSEADGDEKYGAEFTRMLWRASVGSTGARWPPAATRSRPGFWT